MASLPTTRPLQSICAACRRHQIRSRWLHTSASRHYANESNLPRIASTSFWASLIPKPFRRPTDPVEAAERARIRASRSKEWNPATVFLILGIVVGSNAIQIIALRNEMLNFSRKTDAKLSLLREIVQRVKDGEEVDVRRALGTGDPQQEAEWEEVMRELEQTDMLEEGRKKREAKRAERLSRKRSEKGGMLDAESREGSSRSEDTDTQQNANERRPKFLM